jgi:hypothetical protein
MLYIHLYVVFSSKFGNFINFLEKICVGLAFSSIFDVLWFSRLSVTSLILVQFGCKLPKVNSLVTT